jgi:hypothetical protein
MLPNVHISYSPAAQLVVLPLITGDIIPDLLIPISQVRFRLTEASWASVPKTPIDEYGEVQFRKIHIRTPWNSPADTVSTYAHRPKIFPESDFDRRIFPADSRHQTTSLFLGKLIHTCFPRLPSFPHTWNLPPHALQVERVLVVTIYTLYAFIWRTESEYDDLPFLWLSADAT